MNLLLLCIAVTAHALRAALHAAVFVAPAEECLLGQVLRKFVCGGTVEDKIDQLVKLKQRRGSTLG